MVSRVCTTPGCGTLIRLPSTDYKCDRHKRAVDQARGSRQDRGYDAEHDKLRAAWQRRLDRGELVMCWRCLVKQIDPTDWHLGHCDVDRTKYHGPECPPCNQATMGRVGCPHSSHAPPPF